jgi:hypothetical protein
MIGRRTEEWVTIAAVALAHDYTVVDHCAPPSIVCVTQKILTNQIVRFFLSSEFFSYSVWVFGI